MAEYDDKAFGSMQKGAPDYAAGGAIMFDSPWQMKATSDYDDKYSASQKGKFDESVGNLFKSMYDTDTNLEGKREKIDLRSYIRDLDLDLLKERNLAMEGHDERSFGKLSSGERGDLFWAKRAYAMADKHYGDTSRIKDIGAKYWSNRPQDGGPQAIGE